MFNNRIADMLRNEVAIEWHGTNDGDTIEETVSFANGCELELRLEFPEPEEMEDEEESDYVLVAGDEKNPVLVHKDVVDVYIECASEEELREIVVTKDERDAEQ